MNKSLFSSWEYFECNNDEKKEVSIVDESTYINFNEQVDKIEENEESDESSNNESSNDTDNDSEVTKSLLCVFYESYFWKSFKESVINEKKSIQTITIMTS